MHIQIMLSIWWIKWYSFTIFCIFIVYFHYGSYFHRDSPNFILFINNLRDLMLANWRISLDLKLNIHIYILLLWCNHKPNLLCLFLFFIELYLWLLLAKFVFFNNACRRFRNSNIKGYLSIVYNIMLTYIFSWLIHLIEYIHIISCIIILIYAIQCSSKFSLNIFVYFIMQCKCRYEQYCYIYHNWIIQPYCAS